VPAGRGGQGPPGRAAGSRTFAHSRRSWPAAVRGAGPPPLDNRSGSLEPIELSAPTEPLQTSRAAPHPARPARGGSRRISTSAATPSAACSSRALAALRRDLRTPPPECQQPRCL